MTIGIVNDGRMAWKMTAGDYVDGSGMPLSAIGVAIAINLTRFEIGWMSYDKGEVPQRDHWLWNTDPDVAGISETKPPGNVVDQWRFAVRSKATGPRTLTAAGTPMMHALNTLHDEWLQRPESLDGEHVPVVLLGARNTSTNAAKPFLVPTFEIVQVIEMPAPWRPVQVQPHTQAAPGVQAVHTVAVNKPVLTVQEMQADYATPAEPRAMPVAEIMAQIKAKGAAA